MPVKQDLTEGTLDCGAMRGWEISVARDAIPAEQYAAEELQQWFGQRTGLDLPIRAGTGTGKRHVSIGFDPDLGQEGFRIVVEPERVEIAGGRPRGALYGVYQFLEGFLGVRFLTCDHTHVPEEGAEPIPCGSYAYVPPFSFRDSYYRENREHPEFAARLRVNTVADEARLGGKTGQELINHSVHMLVPFDRHGVEHPEYYALVDGKRDTETHAGGPQLCVTNPEVIEVAAASAIEHLDAHPTLENLSVSQADTIRYCRCPECEAVNQREGTPMGSQLAFVNAVAERVEEKHRAVMIGTLAYKYTRQVPRTVRPRANVQIQLCSIECCTLHPIDDPDCPRNGDFCRDMEEWGQVSDEIWIWNYNTNFRAYDLPFPNLRSIAPNVRYFLRSNAKGVFMQANGNGRTGELCDLRNYLIGRSLWTPEIDGDQLRREFVELHYREAAGPIGEYLEMLHDNAEARGDHPNHAPTLEQLGLDAEVARQSMAYFVRALELATDETVRRRVEKASISVHRAMIATEAWNYDTERRALIERYISLCQRHGMTNAAEHRLAEDFFDELRSS